MSDDDYTNNRYFDKINYFTPVNQLTVFDVDEQDEQPNVEVKEENGEVKEELTELTETKPPEPELPEPELTEIDLIVKYEEDFDTFIYQGYDFNNYNPLENISTSKKNVIASTRIRDSWINQITELNTNFGFKNDLKNIENCFFEDETKKGNLYYFGYYKLYIDNTNTDIHCYNIINIKNTDIKNLKEKSMEQKYIITFTKEDEDSEVYKWNELSKDFSIFLKYTRGSANFNEKDSYRFITNIDMVKFKLNIPKEEKKLSMPTIKNYISPKIKNNLTQSLVVYKYKNKMYKFNRENLIVLSAGSQKEKKFYIEFKHKYKLVTSNEVIINPADILIFMPFFSYYPRWVKFNEDIEVNNNIITIYSETLNQNEFYSKYFTIIDPPKNNHAQDLDVIYGLHTKKKKMFFYKKSLQILLVALVQKN